ncbi:WXG100 family type VII secretion target [Saccharopolyspora sp. 5N708]|uniref:WXG100 family type VII secretion target n=1 Tax=Saccharopolyspora sp. 5N708 TaxID=3457424 RepID=UPI003FD2CA56
MVELGQTTDPKALIPGEPDTVENTAAKFRTQSEKFNAVGEDLKHVDVVGWSGAASDAFMDLLSKEPPKWLKSGDALDSAANALTEHAGTLRWAQAQAAEAIALWQEGEEATEKAKDQHNAAVAQANAQNQANVTDGHSNVVSVEPFSDPGERLREEARQLLSSPRTGRGAGRDVVGEADFSGPHRAGSCCRASGADNRAAPHAGVPIDPARSIACWIRPRRACCGARGCIVPAGRAGGAFAGR